MNKPWAVGDLLAHRDNPDLGAGRVVAVEGRALEVEFPAAGARLRLFAQSPALVPVAEEDAAPRRRSVAERLAAGDLDPPPDFALRLEALRLFAVREADGLGSFLGGRIRLFPHQLHVAERATRQDPVRWLLADEVGLGKTVEACLILNHLVRTRRVERCLVVAPDTLTVQWLGELWRKYHQVFVLLDEERLADVEKDFGRGFNPFDAHRRVVVSMEMLVARPRLTRQAVEAGIDLLVVDEAHRLRRPRGHAGNPAFRAIAPLAGLGRHVLLLTATPLDDDAHGFLRLLQLLRPDVLPDEESVEERLAGREPLPACTSSTRRTDVGGLPPRVGRPVDLPPAPPREALEAALRAAPATDALARRRALDRLRRGLASGAALLAVLGPGDDALRGLAAQADADDPRLGWLAAQARGWKEAGHKTLIFTAHRETLDLVRTALSHRAQLATAAFHEQLPAARRDIEVAQFRLPAGPSVLVSTEAGGEGRNFEFCHRLVLFDLPWNPVAVEQRIGRLDRIGRSRDVEIVYFRPAAGLGREAARALEEVGLFRAPLAGLEPEMARVEAALERRALGTEEDGLFARVSEARSARERVRQAAGHALHRDPYRPEHGPALLARVPQGLDALNESVVTTGCARLGLAVEAQSSRRRYAIELGHEARVDSLPGVPGGASFVGTFDRPCAVEDETIDFFAAGHALVEGVLAHIDDSPEGRVAALHVSLGGERGLGLLALYRDEAHGFHAVALDPSGRERPEWAAALTSGALPTRREASPQPAAAWTAAIRRLLGALPSEPSPAALAALILEG